jgi:hypothetical protein
MLLRTSTAATQPPIAKPVLSGGHWWVGLNLVCMYVPLYLRPLAASPGPAVQGLPPLSSSPVRLASILVSWPPLPRVRPPRECLVVPGHPSLPAALPFIVSPAPRACRRFALHLSHQPTPSIFLTTTTTTPLRDCKRTPAPAYQLPAGVSTCRINPTTTETTRISFTTRQYGQGQVFV